MNKRPSNLTNDNKAIAQTITHTLDNYNIKFDIIYTPHKGYAKQYVHSIEPTLYHSILILGGDGTINEILNGILSRSDKYLPTFGFLPGGTGNSVVHDLQYLDPLSALQPMLNNHIKSIDVMVLQFSSFIEY